MNESILPYRVSFIVIAKNESLTISKCIYSIISCGEALLDYEVIFIDSLSSDDTLKKVMNIKNNKIKIIQITKNPHRARARNLGAKFAKFEYIFFVDGDVEICFEFVETALDEMRNSNKIGCVYGQLEHIYYDTNYKNIIKVKRNIKKRLSGGNFLTKKIIFQKLQGFDERIKREDWDFMLRLKTKYKIVFLRKKMGLHNTIPYRNFKRIKNEMFNCNYRFVGFLIRKYLFSFNSLFCIIKEEYGNYMGGFIWFLGGLSFLIHSSFLGFICLLLFSLDIILGLKKEPNNLIGRLISHYIFPWIILFGLFFCFPREKRSEWVRLK